MPSEYIYHSCKEVEPIEEDISVEEHEGLENIEIEETDLQTVEVSIMEVTDEFLASGTKQAEGFNLLSKLLTN